MKEDKVWSKKYGSSWIIMFCRWRFGFISRGSSIKKYHLIHISGKPENIVDLICSIVSEGFCKDVIHLF